MDSTKRPDAYGVFKPVGHVIVSFPTQADMQGALSALLTSGFANDEVIVYSPDQMKRQADIEHAGMLASIGQDLDLMKANLDLAEQGHSFQVADIARRFNATRAQKYGRFLIEELIEVGSGETQVFESADRGLDSLTRFGVVGDAERVGR